MAINGEKIEKLYNEIEQYLGDLGNKTTQEGIKNLLKDIN